MSSEYPTSKLKMSAEPSGVKIVVSVADQELTVLRNGQVVEQFPISTSRFGVGMEEGSLRTPIGKFRICEKIGDGAPAWSVFRGRKPTGEIARRGGTEDLVLTRILWLEGIEPHNANTRQRYIYIHGTNQEDSIGTPASHGCIRLRNADMIRLFDLVTTGAQVEILEDARS